MKKYVLLAAAIDLLHIDVAAGEWTNGELGYQVTGLSGRRVGSGKAQHRSVPVHNLAPGSYILTLGGSGGKAVKSFQNHKEEDDFEAEYR